MRIVISYRERRKEVMNEQEYLSNYDPSKYERVSITADIVVLARGVEKTDNYRRLDKLSLKVLLVQRGEFPFKGMWALPGGFIRADESAEEAAVRELKEETGVSGLYLEQLYTYTDVKRDPRMRVISVAYIGMLSSIKEVEASTDAVKAEWFDIKEALEMQLAFDHKKILEDTLNRIKNKAEYTDIVLNLLGEKFTLTEMQEMYEIVLDKPLLKANFRRKTAELVEDTGEYVENKGFRPSKLYRRKGK